MQFLISIFSSPFFTRLTHRIFYLLLLLTNLAIPLGQHRAWAGFSGWWVFPTLVGLSLGAALLYLSGHGEAWKLAGIPYTLLFVADALAVAAVLPPKQRAGKP